MQYCITYSRQISWSVVLYRVSVICWARCN